MHCFFSPMFREQALSDCLSRVHEEALIDVVGHFQPLGWRLAIAHRGPGVFQLLHRQLLLAAA